MSAARYYFGGMADDDVPRTAWGRMVFIGICLAATIAILWVFAVYVARPFALWYNDTTGWLGFAAFVVAVAGFYWWSMRRERRLIAEGKIEPPRGRKPGSRSRP